MITIITGDDSVSICTLKKNKSTFVIANDAVIKAKVVDVARTKSITNTVTLNNLHSDADLANSKVVVEISSAETTLIEDYGTAILEIQVDDTIKTTWFQEVNIIKGMID